MQAAAHATLEGTLATAAAQLQVQARIRPEAAAPASAAPASGAASSAAIATAATSKAAAAPVIGEGKPAAVVIPSNIVYMDAPLITKQNCKDFM